VIYYFTKIKPEHSISQIHKIGRFSKITENQIYRNLGCQAFRKSLENSNVEESYPKKFISRSDELFRGL